MKTLVFLVVVVTVSAATLQLRYGAGEPYPDLGSEALLAEEALETVLSYPEPIGNVAVTDGGRLFFTVHPESRPRGNRLLEWIDGAAEPYPNGSVQQTLFQTVLGLYIDRQQRLWSIDHGNHGFGDARLLAFDLASDELVFDRTLSSDIAPAGSMLQDLRVSHDGRWVFMADASIWRQRPAIIVYDTQTQTARRVLENHPSVTAENYLIRTPTRDMSYLGGLLSLKAGVDGLTLDAAGDWLYYGAINHSGLFRVPMGALIDASLPDRQVANQVERVTDKPLSDGLNAGTDGSIYITDVEHGAVFRWHPDSHLEMLVRSPRVRWADNLDFGEDGWLYLADSAIPDLVLQTGDHIRGSGPYRIFRFPVPQP